jgi:hypothetical protein
MFPNSHRLLPAVEDALDIRARFCEAEQPNGRFRATNLKLRPAAWGRLKILAQQTSPPLNLSLRAAFPAGIGSRFKKIPRLRSVAHSKASRSS